MAQLQGKIQSHEQLATTPETLSELLKLAPQIAELECRLQEAEYQKLQAELEREAAIEEVEAMQNFVTLLHVQLGKIDYVGTIQTLSKILFFFFQMNLPRSPFIPKA